MFVGFDIQAPSPQKPLFLHMEVGRIKGGGMGDKEGSP
jgi:hypothetical protein